MEEVLTSFTFLLDKGARICIASPKSIDLSMIGVKIGYKHLEKESESCNNLTKTLYRIGTVLQVRNLYGEKDWFTVDESWDIGRFKYRPATEQEEFLFILNNSQPFVMENIKEQTNV